MNSTRTGLIAVIFASQRTSGDADGYRIAAADMEALAEAQPGYAGMIAARDSDGFGITVSYWHDEDSARAWRAHPHHADIREQGRGKWYESYTVDVAVISRDYQWSRND